MTHGVIGAPGRKDYCVRLAAATFLVLFIKIDVHAPKKMATNNFTMNTLPEILSLDLAGELSSSRQQKPWHSGLFSKLLFKAGDLRLILIAMETGAAMKEHHAEGTVSIHALQGPVWVYVQEQPQVLNAGQMLIIPAGMKHRVEAREDSAFLLTIASPQNMK
ncbi:MAG: cupin domain-containing protein [Acidobacteriota bacterium]|nr:cupin domain-containing protein [Acidobacteriota bacterium]